MKYYTKREVADKLRIDISHVKKLRERKYLNFEKKNGRLITTDREIKKMKSLYLNGERYKEALLHTLRLYKYLKENNFKIPGHVKALMGEYAVMYRLLTHPDFKDNTYHLSTKDFDILANNKKIDVKTSVLNPIKIKGIDWWGGSEIGTRKGEDKKKENRNRKSPDLPKNMDIVILVQLEPEIPYVNPSNLIGEFKFYVFNRDEINEKHFDSMKSWGGGYTIYRIKQKSTQLSSKGRDMLEISKCKHMNKFLDSCENRWDKIR